jgi:hypothetical protein
MSHAPADTGQDVGEHLPATPQKTHAHEPAQGKEFGNAEIGEGVGKHFPNNPFATFRNNPFTAVGLSSYLHTRT